MISLADLRARGVLPTWQESVAVVQELLQTVMAAGAPVDRLPDLEHVALIPNGDVVALPGSPSSESPVRHLGSLLAALLEGGNPPGELTALAEQAVTTPGQFGSVDEFSKALAFFERPGRRGDIERLVLRAMTVEAQSRADEELRRLKERTVDAAERTPIDETLMMARPKRRAAVPAIAAGLVLALAVAGAAWYRFRPGRPALDQTQRQSTPDGQQAAAGQTPSGGQPPGGGESPAEQTAAGGATPAVGQTAAGGQTPSAEQAAPGQTSPEEQPPAPKGLIARAADAIRSAVDAVIPPAKEAAPQAEASPAAAVKSKPKASRSRRTTAPAAPVPPPPPVAPPRGEITSVRTVPMTEAEPASVAAVTELSPPSVYTSADPAVMPPVMIRPVLPATPPPGVSPDQVGTLDLLIDETGSVEQVKLTSPANRYQERMLVSHAKSWKFKPALRDGQPVKYRTRVRVTI